MDTVNMIVVLVLVDIVDDDYIEGHTAL